MHSSDGSHGGLAGSPPSSIWRAGARTGAWSGHHSTSPTRCGREIRTRGVRGFRTRDLLRPPPVPHRRAPGPRPAQRTNSPRPLLLNVRRRCRCRRAIDHPGRRRPSGPEAEIAEWGTPRLGHLLTDVTKVDMPRLALAPIVRTRRPASVGECNRVNDGHCRSRRRLPLRCCTRGIDLRTELLEQVLPAGLLGLFTAVYGESHCAGSHLCPRWPGDSGRLDTRDRHPAVMAKRVYRASRRVHSPGFSAAPQARR